MRACCLLTVRRGDGVGGVLRGPPSARRAAFLPCLPSRRAGGCRGRRSPTLRGSGDRGLPREVRLPQPPLLSLPPGCEVERFPAIVLLALGTAGASVWERLAKGFAGGSWLLIALCAEEESASPGTEPGHYLLIGAGRWQRED